MQKILKTRFSTDESILMDIKKGGKFVQFQYANILPLGGGVSAWDLCPLLYTMFCPISQLFDTGGHTYC